MEIKTTFTLELSKDLHKRLKTAAAQQGKPMKELLIKMIEEYLKEKK